ncbi:MAG: hypothetical protein WCF33_07405 [Pseudonocardiaceae bacterium]
MTPEAVLARFREYMVGPARFMNLLSCFELGIIDALRESSGMTAAKLGDAVDATPDAVEQLLRLLIKEEFVSYDEGSSAYSLDVLAGVAKADLQRVLTLMDMIKLVMLRQVFYLTDSVRTGTIVGMNKLYGFEGNLYGAVAEHKDLRESWATLMGNVTARIDPWFFDNIDIPSGSQVLDLAGNTGLGAIHTYRLKASPGLWVTTFDLSEKEKECLENFRTHGVDFFPTFFLGCTMARAGHRSCRSTEVGWKKVGSLPQRRLPRTLPTYHRTPSPYTASCARRRPHDQAEFRHPRRRRLSPRSSPASGSPMRSRCDAPPSRSYGVHQPGVPRHCGVLRGAASGNFTYRR